MCAAREKTQNATYKHATYLFVLSTVRSTEVSLDPHQFAKQLHTWHSECTDVKLPWKACILQLFERRRIFLDEVFLESYVEMTDQMGAREGGGEPLTKHSIHMISFLEAGLFRPEYDTDSIVGDPTRIANEYRCGCLRAHCEVLTALLYEKSPATSDVTPP